MYFEFEESEAGSSKSSNTSLSSNDGSVANNVSSSPPPPPRSSSNPTFRRCLFNVGEGISENSHCMPQYSTPNSSSSFSSSTPNSHLSNRYRRYSMTASPSSVTLDSLHDNGNVTYCDLALITKKKLLQINCSFVKAIKEELPEPDIKLNQSFQKHSAKDLRREVLLTSIQRRSLSVSSDDFSNLSPIGNRTSDLSTGEMDKSDTENDDLMETNSNNNNNNIASRILLSNGKSFPSACTISTDVVMNESASFPSDYKRSPLISRYRARRSLSPSIYMPSESQNNCMNSQTTFTSTTSMAGGSKNGLNHCRGYIKRFHANCNNGAAASPTAAGSYYYSNSASPKLTLTMSSLLDNPLKKRLHSSSPSKNSTSPYAICKDFPLVFANAPSPLSPEWDMAFKRLKVMHCNIGEVDVLDEKFDTKSLHHQNNNNDNDENNHHEQVQQQQQSNTLIQQQQSSLTGMTSTPTPFGDGSGGGCHQPPQDQHELNELTQDFHRLKTPFT